MRGAFDTTTAPVASVVCVLATVPAVPGSLATDHASFFV